MLCRLLILFSIFRLTPRLMLRSFARVLTKSDIIDDIHIKGNDIWPAFYRPPLARRHTAHGIKQGI